MGSGYQPGIDTPSHILVVEDEHDLRELIVEALVQDGYRVVAASGGDEALASMRASTPSFVVMDLMMPGMSGYQLAEEMERDSKLRSIPVCVITASLYQPLPAQALCILPKPFQLADLLRTVAHYLRGG